MPKIKQFASEFAFRFFLTLYCLRWVVMGKGILK